MSDLEPVCVCLREKLVADPLYTLARAEAVSMHDGSG